MGEGRKLIMHKEKETIAKMKKKRMRKISSKPSNSA